jgi:hypothetical protein
MLESFVQTCRTSRDVSSRLVSVQDLCRSPFGTCVVQESGSSGVWTVGVVGRSFGVVGQAHIRLWLCQDRWHSKFRGSCMLPWALPCLRGLVAVRSVRPGRIRPGLPSPSTTDASSAIPQIIPQTPHVTLLLELALIVQPITVRDEQLLEASGNILDHIVSTAPLVLIHHRGHLPSCLITTRSHDLGNIPGRRASLNVKPVGQLPKLAPLLCADEISSQPRTRCRPRPQAPTPHPTLRRSRLRLQVGAASRARVMVAVRLLVRAHPPARVVPQSHRNRHLPRAASVSYSIFTTPLSGASPVHHSGRHFHCHHFSFRFHVFTKSTVWYVQEFAFRMLNSWMIISDLHSTETSTSLGTLVELIKGHATIQLCHWNPLGVVVTFPLDEILAEASGRACTFRPTYVQDLLHFILVVQAVRFPTVFG